MSQLESFCPDVTMYSDKASMTNGNGSNGDSTLPIATPQTIKEAKTEVVSHTQIQLVAILFRDRRNSVYGPDYHQHVQGAIGTDDETRQQVFALANQLYNFGH